jgi:hypothetical protein
MSFTDHQTSIVLNKLPKGHFVGILGSTSFYNGDSESICKEIGAQLAELEGS